MEMRGDGISSRRTSLTSYHQSTLQGRWMVWSGCSLGYGEHSKVPDLLRRYCAPFLPSVLSFHRELEGWELHFPDSFASWLSPRSCRGDWKVGGRGRLLCSGSGRSLWGPEAVTVLSVESGDKNPITYSVLAVSPGEARQLRQHQNSGSVLRSSG